MDVMMENQQLCLSQDPGDNIVRNVKTEEEENELKVIKVEEIPLQVSSDSGDTIVRNVKTEEEGGFVEEAVPLLISPVQEESMEIAMEEKLIECLRPYPELYDTNNCNYLSYKLKQEPRIEIAKELNFTNGLSMDTLDEQVIECVRQHPAIYDTSNSQYLKTKYKHQLWIKIAKELHIKNVKEVKNCWTKLRSQHRDALRRQRRNLSSGAAAKPSKPWKFQRQMAFLLAYRVNDSRDTNFTVEEEQAYQLPEELPQDLESHSQSLNAASLEGVETSTTAEAAHDDSIESSASAIPRIIAMTSAARPRKKARSVPVDHVLLQHIAPSNKRAKQRMQERQNMAEDHTDSLYLFFHCMYQQTKNMRPEYQMEIKRILFSAVSKFEEMSLDSNVPSNTAEYHQLQPMSAHDLPEYNFPCQAEANFPPHSTPCATPSTSTEGVVETTTSSVFHLLDSSEV